MKTAVGPRQNVGHDDKFNDESIPTGTEYRGDPHAALLIAAVRRPCFGSKESASDYSGDHENTREVTQFPGKLLLSLPSGGHLSREKWSVDGRNTLLAAPSVGNFLNREGFGSPPCSKRGSSREWGDSRRVAASVMFVRHIERYPGNGFKFAVNSIQASVFAD